MSKIKKVNGIEITIVGRADRLETNGAIIYIILCWICNKEKEIDEYSLQYGKRLAHKVCAAKLRRANEKVKRSEDDLKQQVVLFMIRRAKGAANVRKLNFELTELDVMNLIFSSCHYCGAMPDQIYTHIVEAPFNGIDRINSNLGYTKENCITCCKTCNYGKRDMSYKRFIKYLDQVVKFRTKQ